MKIVSWNVNGIRAILKKGFAESFASLSPDVLFLEETKWSEPPEGKEPFPFLPEGYHLAHTISKEKKGYSGVAAFYKKEPLSIHFGLKDGKYDDEGRVITLEYPSFYLVGAYVPNSGEGLKRLPFRMGFEDDLLAYLEELDAKKPILYTGDLNVAHEEIDIKNPASNRNNAGFTDQERERFSRLLSHGFVDVWREEHPDEVCYTWWSYRFHARENNAGWRIDYFVASKRLMPQLREAEIEDSLMGSDHCPISVILDD